jgi:hypothetical protein
MLASSTAALLCFVFNFPLMSCFAICPRMHSQFQAQCSALTVTHSSGALRPLRMSDAASVAEIAVSEKDLVITAGGSEMRLRLHFKDAYILRAGQCDFTGLRVWPGAELLARGMHQLGRGQWT